MPRSEYCIDDNHMACNGRPYGVWCNCVCHGGDDDEHEFGGFDTVEEYYDEWGWP